MIVVRAERPDEQQASRSVLLSAFPSDAEARLVDLLRNSGKLLMSFVASFEDRIIGFAGVCPVEIIGNDGTTVQGCVGLAPLAVAPEFQRSGVGTRLAAERIVGCRRADVPLAVVLAKPGATAKFGFRKASDWGLRNEYGADAAFTLLEFKEGAIPKGGGLVRFPAEFAQVGA